MKCKDSIARHLLYVYFVSAIFFLGLSSCINRSVNNPADDLAQTNFINKSTIYLLGRKPYANEMVDARNFFLKNGFDRPSREQYLLNLSSGSEYKLYLYQLARNELVNMIFKPDSADIQKIIDEMMRSHPDYKEKARLMKLQTISREMLSGRLDNIGMQKRLVHNLYYDFINMGTENFVVSMYNNFLDRPPTRYELTQGKMMVDNSDAVFWGRAGHSKEDFIALFFDSYPYYEGQVRMLYKRYYYTEPTPEYLTSLTLEYYKTRDYRKLQVEMLSLDEFVAS